MMEPTLNPQVSTLSWHQQKEQFRENARKEMRLREGLPEVVNGYYVVDGKRYGMAVGKVKGPAVGKTLAEGITEAALHSETGFILKYEGSKEFNQEFRDLDRDADLYERYLTVRHETQNPIAQTYQPEIPDAVLEDESKLAEFLENHGRP